MYIFLSNQSNGLVSCKRLVVNINQAVTSLSENKIPELSLVWLDVEKLWTKGGSRFLSHVKCFLMQN